MINTGIFENIKTAQKKILVVTKYWDKQKSFTILEESKEKYPDIFYGLGENRIETIIEKKLPREHMHFIGNIQSQKISQIVQHCSCIHSLSSIKHAKKIENMWRNITAFIQIRLDENKRIWIWASELSNFLEVCKNMKHLKIIGISGMWSREYSEQEKRNEFRKLISLRDIHLPNRYISAGTSRDYQIALEEWIDIVRIGSKSLD